MFVCTFYSFKGGVGRSLALMNVAAALTHIGRKVLVVDFDLEAPGLTTFDACESARNKPGLVEYVTSYRKTGKAPDVAEYIYECSPKLRLDDGTFQVLPGMSIMPAGNVDDPSYPAMFSALDWRALYDDENGFLLFEEMKAQWEDLEFDYVLLDSRTGHTDISGICTRQLPEAVAMVFFPNEQNLAGLKQIVSDVRNEPSAEDEISIHFVGSRVPRLDDEYEILNKWLARFQHELEYDSASLSLVHHYDSLALLDQKLFVLDRPKTLLAKELRGLSDKISMLNNEDVRGVIHYLQSLSLENNRISPSFYETEDKRQEGIRRRLDVIHSKHADNYAVMYLLAQYYYEASLLSDAEKVIDLAASSLSETVMEHASPDTIVGIHLLRMRIYRDMDRDENAISSALQLLRFADISGASLRDAFLTISLLGSDYFPHPDDIPALKKLSPAEVSKSFIVLSYAGNMLNYAARGLRWLFDYHGYEALENVDRLTASLRLIAAGEMVTARNLIDSEKAPSDFQYVAMTFNRAMVEWAISGEPDVSAFETSYEAGMQLDVSEDSFESNFYQCMALAAGIIGKSDEATYHLSRATASVSSEPGMPFSVWSFVDVTKQDFIADCRKISDYLFKSGPPPAIVAEYGKCRG